MLVLQSLHDAPAHAGAKTAPFTEQFRAAPGTPSILLKLFRCRWFELACPSIKVGLVDVNLARRQIVVAPREPRPQFIPGQVEEPHLDTQSASESVPSASSHSGDVRRVGEPPSELVRRPSMPASSPSGITGDRWHSRLQAQRRIVLNGTCFCSGKLQVSVRETWNA
jgi:hypothetical protein